MLVLIEDHGLSHPGDFVSPQGGFRAMTFFNYFSLLTITNIRTYLRESLYMWENIYNNEPIQLILRLIGYMKET